MKILVIHPSTKLVGGGNIAHYNFIKSLVRIGSQIVTVSYDGNNYDQDVSKKHYSIKLKRSSSIRKYSFNPKLFLFLFRIVKYESPDKIIIGQINYLLTLYLSLSIFNKKTYHVVHSAEYGCLNAMLTRMDDKSPCEGVVGIKCLRYCNYSILNFGFRIVLNNARNFLLKRFISVFICHSRFMYDYMIRNGFVNVKYVPLYLSNVEKIVPSEKVISKKEIKLIFVGTLTWNKGFNEIIEAISKIKCDSQILLHYDIVGNGPLMKYSIEKLKNSKGITYNIHGTLPHSKTLELIKKSDILLFPSYFESLGLVVLESMMYSKFIIISNRGALPEITKNYRKKIIIEIININNIIKSIEEAIKIILNNEKNEKIQLNYKDKYYMDDILTQMIQ